MFNPERDLIALAASGDPGAQRRLVERLAGRVRRTARALLRDAAEADDAAQNALLAILRAGASYRGEGALERWADRIAVRTVLHGARARRKAERGLDAGVDVESLEADPSAPSAEPEAMSEQMNEHLSALGEPLRTTLLLRHVFEHSIDEIAELTAASPNTVKDRLLRAREQMRKQIRRAAVVDVARDRARESSADVPVGHPRNLRPGKAL